MSNDEHFMEVAIEEARKAPWPFGAAVVVAGEIISQAGSGDGKDNHMDPTAHAEVNAIRFACKSLNVNSLEGKDAIIYASCEPCAMCMGAIWYAGIRKIIYGSTIEEEQKFFPWKDLIFPRDVLMQLTNNELSITGGLFKNRVMEVYESHSARVN